MNKETGNEVNNTEILYSPNAYDGLIRYLDKVNEYQNSIKDELEVTRDHVRHLEVEVYRLQATTQALREHVTSTANVISPQDIITNRQVDTNTTHTICSDDDTSTRSSHRTSKKKKK